MDTVDFFLLGNGNVTRLAVKSWSSRSSFLTFSVSKTPPFFSLQAVRTIFHLFHDNFCHFFNKKTCPKKLVVNPRKKFKENLLTFSQPQIHVFAVDQPLIFLNTQGGGEWLRYKGKVVQV